MASRWPRSWELERYSPAKSDSRAYDHRNTNLFPSSQLFVVRTNKKEVVTVSDTKDAATQQQKLESESVVTETTVYVESAAQGGRGG